MEDLALNNYFYLSNLHLRGEGHLVQVKHKQKDMFINRTESFVSCHYSFQNKNLTWKKIWFHFPIWPSYVQQIVFWLITANFFL